MLKCLLIIKVGKGILLEKNISFILRKQLSFIQLSHFTFFKTNLMAIYPEEIFFFQSLQLDYSQGVVIPPATLLALRKYKVVKLGGLI